MEDDASVLESACRVLERRDDIEIAGKFLSAEEAIKADLWGGASVLIADLGLPGISGIELIRSVREKFPKLLLLAYTLFEDRDTVFAALRAGASGYLLKGCSATDLEFSIRRVMAGESPMSPAIARWLLDRFLEMSPDAELLSVREEEIVRLLAQGLYYKEVGDRLGISPHTVHSHIKKIYGKLHAVDRVQALRQAKFLGYLDG